MNRCTVHIVAGKVLFGVGHLEAVDSDEMLWHYTRGPNLANRRQLDLRTNEVLLIHEAPQ